MDRYTQDARSVVEEFYAHYERVSLALRNAIHYRDGNDHVLPKAVMQDYASLVLNRLFFMAFLESERGDLPPVVPVGFLSDVYERYRSGRLPTFSSFYRVLRAIWFSYLDSDHSRTSADGIFKVVPFLGGNVFHPVPSIEIDTNGVYIDVLEIDDVALQSALAVIDAYDWQIAENRSETANARISPAILGHIFEMSCNRKESGTYYTPAFITDYMARKSLSMYATCAINDHYHTSYDDFIREVILRHDKSADDVAKVSWFYFNVLSAITICDPACGSGAFLVAVEQVLVEMYVSCIGCIDPGDPRFFSDAKLPRPGSPLSDIKQHVIVTNIYGVDLQPGSVAAARIRLSLSLVAVLDMNPGVSLPSIDENIKDGNSLLGFVTPSDGSTNCLAIHTQKVYEAFERSRVSSRDRLEAIERLDGLFLQRTGDGTGPYLGRLFHWGVEFPGVIQRGGFDVIIGNPPYLSFSSSKVKKGLIGKAVVRRFYKNADDVYEAFIIRTLQLCRGIASLIVPYSFYRQIGARMTRHLLAYDNLGEGIFVGVSIAVSIVFFDQKTHPSFDFQNYTFLEDKASQIGKVPVRQVSSFELFKDDPVVAHVDSVARTHASYGLEVMRGEELGKKALSTKKEPGHVPIYTAAEMVPFKLLPPTYSIDPAAIKKNFYHGDKVGVNLAFRNRIKASFIGDVYTIKSIICIHRGSRDTLIEVLGTWNSKLFDWYHDKCFSGFQEIRLNTITDIKNRYPLLLPDKEEFRWLVKYLIVQYEAYLHRIIDFVVYDLFLHERLALDGASPVPHFALLDAVRPHILPVAFDAWSALRWRSLKGGTLLEAERRELERLESGIIDVAARVAANLKECDVVQGIMDSMKAHPWIVKIERETADR